MSAIILLIFLGILVAGGFLAAFIWAVRSGQYDDDYSPSVRMLYNSSSDTTDITVNKDERDADQKTEHEAGNEAGYEAEQKAGQKAGNEAGEDLVLKVEHSGE